MKIQLAAILALTSASACVSAPAFDPPAETVPPLETEARSRELEPVLYARDGRPVEAGDPGEAGGEEPLSARDLAGNQGGRMYILELYQGVIEERDQLALEVETLGAEIERARAALAAADQRIAELEAALATAGAENQRQRTENVDLAGRLATAQIRRLQAEKILLELRLAEIASRPEPSAAADQP
jgi:hypothetical protein